MDTRFLTTAIDGFPELAPYRDLLLRIARPSVEIDLVDDAPLPHGSRFGGHPWVPHDFAWPKHPIGEYRFLGQFDFQEIVESHGAARCDALPANGLLSLFYATDEEGEVFWQDDDYVLGFFWPRPEGHHLLGPPEGSAPDARRLALRSRLRLPERRELLGDDASIDEDALETMLHVLPKHLDLSGQWLLGYPLYGTLAYDPTPGDGWMALLTLPSLDAFEWCWHDGDRLMVFIETSRLAMRDFAHLRCDAG